MAAQDGRLILFLDISVFASILDGIKSKHSTLNVLGKIFFRGQPPWEQRRKMVLLLWSAAAGAIVGGALVGWLFVENTRR